MAKRLRKSGVENELQRVLDTSSDERVIEYAATALRHVNAINSRVSLVDRVIPRKRSKKLAKRDEQEQRVLEQRAQKLRQAKAARVVQRRYRERALARRMAEMRAHEAQILAIQRAARAKQARARGALRLRMKMRTGASGVSEAAARRLQGAVRTAQAARALRLVRVLETVGAAADERAGADGGGEALARAALVGMAAHRQASSQRRGGGGGRAGEPARRYVAFVDEVAAADALAGIDPKLPAGQRALRTASAISRAVCVAPEPTQLEHSRGGGGKRGGARRRGGARGAEADDAVIDENELAVDDAGGGRLDRVAAAAAVRPGGGAAGATTGAGGAPAPAVGVDKFGLRAVAPTMVALSGALGELRRSHGPSPAELAQLRARVTAARWDLADTRARAEERRAAREAVRMLLAAQREREGAVGAEEGGATAALRREVRGLEAAVAEQRQEASRQKSTMSREEVDKMQRALLGARRRKERLEGTLGGLSDPAAIVARQQNVAALRSSLDGLEHERRNLERTVKKLETKLSLAANKKDREAHDATSDARKELTEVGRLGRLCAMAEEETSSAHGAVAAARSELALRQRLLGRLATTLKSISPEIGHAVASAPHQPTGGGSPPAHEHGTQVAAAGEAGGAAGALLLDELPRRQRRLERATAELQGRRVAVQAERAQLENMRARRAEAEAALRFAGGSAVLREGGEGDDDGTEATAVGDASGELGGGGEGAHAAHGSSPGTKDPSALVARPGGLKPGPAPRSRLGKPRAVGAAAAPPPAFRAAGAKLSSAAARPAMAAAPLGAPGPRGARASPPRARGPGHAQEARPAAHADGTPSAVGAQGDIGAAAAQSGPAEPPALTAQGSASGAGAPLPMVDVSGVPRRRPSKMGKSAPPLNLLRAAKAEQ